METTIKTTSKSLSLSRSNGKAHANNKEDSQSSKGKGNSARATIKDMETYQMNQYQDLERKYVKLKFEHAQLQSNPDKRRLRKAEIDRETSYLRQRKLMLAREKIKEKKVQLGKQKKALNQLTDDLEFMTIDQERACYDALNFQTDHGVEKSNQDSVSSSSKELRDHHLSLIKNIASLKETATSLAIDRALIDFKANKIIISRDIVKNQVDDLSCAIDDMRSRMDDSIINRDAYVQETKKIQKETSALQRKFRKRQSKNGSFKEKHVHFNVIKSLRGINISKSEDIDDYGCSLP